MRWITLKEPPWPHAILHQRFNHISNHHRRLCASSNLLPPLRLYWILLNSTESLLHSQLVLLGHVVTQLKSFGQFSHGESTVYHRATWGDWQTSYSYTHSQFGAGVACLCTVGGSWRTRGEPTQPQEEHANPQPSCLEGGSANHCTRLLTLISYIF